MKNKCEVCNKKCNNLQTDIYFNWFVCLDCYGFTTKLLFANISTKDFYNKIDNFIISKIFKY
jgi:hypothetical protein